MQYTLIEGPLFVQIKKDRGKKSYPKSIVASITIGKNQFSSPVCLGKAPTRIDAMQYPKHIGSYRAL